MTAAIDTTGIAKSFGHVAALRDVTLAIEPGELFGLVGPDGAGKTTFLRILAGLLKPSSGRAWIDGTDVAADRAGATRKIGYMSQRFSLSGTLTVLENLLFVAEIWQVPAGERRKRVTRLLEFSRLGPFQGRLTRDLSGGMKQKLSLSTALIHQPRILLLDEPTIGVDPISRRDFWLILYDLLHDGTTILLTTPYMDEAERCSRVGFLSNGGLFACGRPGQLKAQLGTVVLELRCRDPRAAQRRLRNVPGLSEPIPFGERLHIEFPRADFVPEPALARVRAAGIDILQWQVREPSLEDVFLSFARQDADRAEAAHG